MKAGDFIQQPPDTDGGQAAYDEMRYFIGIAKSDRIFRWEDRNPPMLTGDGDRRGCPIVIERPEA